VGGAPVSASRPYMHLLVVGPGEGADQFILTDGRSMRILLYTLSMCIGWLRSPTYLCHISALHSRHIAVF